MISPGNVLPERSFELNKEDLTQCKLQVQFEDEFKTWYTRQSPSNSPDRSLKQRSALVSLCRIINAAFTEDIDQLARKEIFMNALSDTLITEEEIDFYSLSDHQKAYTRNLISANKDYTLIMLVWNPEKESKVHDHPGNGCFMKVLRGQLKETLYSMNKETEEIKKERVRFLQKGLVSYMHDDIGLHKISNVLKDTTTVSLHLYTPPIVSCRVWDNPGSHMLFSYQIASMGYFSMYGRRTPEMEGKPGIHSVLLREIREKVELLL